MNRFCSHKLLAPLLSMGIIAASLLLSGCDEKSEQESEIHVNFQSYTPTSGTKGTMLTLKGEYSGVKHKDVQVWVNDTKTDVINITSSQINVRVPNGAGSGPVKVVVGNVEHIYPIAFEYLVATTYMVTTYAGTGQAGYVDGALDEARFEHLTWLAYDKKEDVVYSLETDVTPQRVRRIKNGKVETVVDFSQQAVRLNNPRTIEFSLTGDTIFVGNDNANNPGANPHAVAILTRDNDFKTVKPYVTYPAATTEHVNFAGINPVDGTLIYYCWPAKLYKWDNDAQKAILLADIKPLILGHNGSYGNVRFSHDGQTIYLTLRDPYQGILSAGYDLETKTLSRSFSRFAGTGSWGSNDGQGTEAGMDQPSQAVVGSDGNLYVVERFNHVVRRITPSGSVTMFAGSPGSGHKDGEVMSAKFFEPLGITIDKNNTMFVGEFSNNRIRMIKEEEVED
ncbi:IPT/TIG domain-containing protein [Dysgonomonas sp. 511]|uniref:IPT/TIG domain-containing protein n=1 Tax=Dysgonomonas sp. 511 TaxID=2302930 RepID=UPI0013D0311B|nr:IPT/TIG domain-containing protein [Dysgonomonas sp. 511]NDV78132.1 hypothetical protein [Dysgonomonas sp. 511]